MVITDVVQYKGIWSNDGKKHQPHFQLKSTSGMEGKRDLTQS